MNSLGATVVCIVAMVLVVAPGASAAEVSATSTCGVSNQSVRVAIEFENDNDLENLKKNAVALQLDLEFDPRSVVWSSSVPGSAVVDHVIDAIVLSDGDDLTPDIVRLLVHSPTNASLSDGTLLEATFEVLDGVTEDIGVRLPVRGLGGYVQAGAVFSNIGGFRIQPSEEPPGGTISLLVLSGPEDANECIGGAITFEANVSRPVTTYQWTKGGEVIAGETGSTLSLEPVEREDAGSYAVKIDINDDQCVGSFTSVPGQLEVQGICAPNDLCVFDTGSGNEVAAIWRPNRSVESVGYRLSWGTSPGATAFTRDLVGSDVGEFVFNALTDDTRYYFRVETLTEIDQSPFSNEATAVPRAERIDLPESMELGFQTPSGDESHPDLTTYRFPGRTGPVSVWYQVYDVDAQGEVDVMLNCRHITSPPQTNAPEDSPNWSAGRLELLLDDSFVNDDQINVLTFDNKLFPGGDPERWGARNVSVRLPAPSLNAAECGDTVVLTMDQFPAESSLGEYWIFRDTDPEFEPRPSGSNPNRIGRDDDVVGSLFTDRDPLAEPAYYRVRPIDKILNPGFDSEVVMAMPAPDDFDGDGFDECQGDCNDRLSGIFPGAEETCNFRDDDCDGVVDEGFDTDCLTAECGTKGDPRCDGQRCQLADVIRSIDQLLVLQPETCEADVTCDGRVSALDVICVIDCLLEIPGHCLESPCSGGDLPSGCTGAANGVEQPTTRPEIGLISPEVALSIADVSLSIGHDKSIEVTWDSPDEALRGIFLDLEIPPTWEFRDVVAQGPSTSLVPNTHVEEGRLRIALISRDATTTLPLRGTLRLGFVEHIQTHWNTPVRVRGVQAAGVTGQSLSYVVLSGESAVER